MIRGYLQELINKFEKTHQNALRLAEVVSIAVRVEPELLRLARLTLVPEANAGDEADLWFSPLVKIRNIQGFVFYPEVAQILRMRLARKKDLLDNVWDKLFIEVHKDISPALLLEEEITWLALKNPKDPKIEDLLQRTLATLVQDDDLNGVSHWFLRAISNLPSSIQDLDIFKTLELGANLRVGVDDSFFIKNRTKLTEILPYWGPFLSSNLIADSIGVRFVEDGIEFGDIDSLKGTEELKLPPTNPLLIDVSWREKSGKKLNELILLRQHENKFLSLDVDEVELNTLSGERYKLYKRVLKDPSISSSIHQQVLYLIREAYENNLELLDLSNKELTHLPLEITKIWSLTELNLFSNLLISLPPEIRELKNLTTLDLSNNQLIQIPPEIGELKSLITLDLSNNQLTQIPPEIGELKNLTTLNLSNNQLTQIPLEIGELKNITSLDIYNNPLSSPNFWRILDHKTHNIRQLVAREIVLKGKANGLENVPICKFGDIETIDRAEIESYNSIKELIIEFLMNQKPKNPLCFAIFGPPSAGKSFGTKQVLKSIDTNGNRLESISFNVSQFGDYQDLVNAFHKIRDLALSGKVPFVFFDEFDSDCNGQPLGWLKYFLAPMQDGKFKEGDEIHPIGNAIFVFAGGTRYTFEDFVQNSHGNGSTPIVISSEDNKTDQNSVQETEDTDKAFRNAKGPDFVSRLRGFINVMGPNRQPSKEDDDDAFIIRRAQLLRVMLENDQRATSLFNSKRELSIDDGVLRALLNVTRYKHGTRSMTAIIEMSRLAGKKCFDLSALPVKKQLDMHVDADEFFFLTEKERYQSMLLMRDLPDPKETSFLKKENSIVESVVAAMDTYMCENKASHRKGKIKKLDEDASYEELKDAAEDIPNKLWAINNGIRKITGKTPHIPDITGDEIETFAELEHGRLCRNKRLRQLSDSNESKTFNNSVLQYKNYDQLGELEKNEFRESVYTIPPILKKAGYEIYRMKNVEEINDSEVINRLARFLHEKYVQERRIKGENCETNPSLVKFDYLPEDIKEANFDNIKKIPEKLSWIGYSTRRVQQDEKQRELTLTEEEIEIMARREHDRWVWQKIMQGWVYKGGKKDFVNKTSPFIVPWNKLPPDIRVNDFNAVRLIPELLKESGYEAYKPDSKKND